MSTSFWTSYRLALLGLLVVATGLSGCQHLRNLGGSCHDPKPYMKAKSIAPLKIPPGLDAPPPFNVPKKAPPQA